MVNGLMELDVGVEMFGDAVGEGLHAVFEGVDGARLSRLAGFSLLFGAVEHGFDEGVVLGFHFNEGGKGGGGGEGVGVAGVDTADEGGEGVVERFAAEAALGEVGEGFVGG